MKASPTAALCGLCCFLSSLICASAQTREVPLESLDLSGASTGWGKIGRGVGASGRTMTIAGEAFDSGVGVHAPSAMTFKLDGGSARFKARVGVDDGPHDDGSVVFQVVADGETIFDSGRMTRGDKPKDVNVDLTGRRAVELRLTDAGDGIDSDHGDWVDARFVVAGETPKSQPLWMMELSRYEGDGVMAADATPVRTVTSPDGRVKLEVYVTDARIWIKVLRDGKPALDASPIGVIVDGVDWGANADAGEAKSYSANETYPWLGNQRTLTNHFNGEQIGMKSGDRDWTLDVRAYDDGAAWRCLIPGSGQRKVNGEATSFVMPSGSAYWTHTNTVAYEANYENFAIDGKAPGKPITMPVTVELPGGGFACYTESDIMHYSGMTFGVNGRMLNGIFEDDPNGWIMDGAFATPWRVVISAPDLNALVNSSIAQSVCPPPDPKLFPKGILTEWIKPGRSFWTWGFGQWDTAKWERIRGYVDDAAKLNCQYYTIDDPWREKRMGWHRNGGDEWDSLAEITRYAAEKGVGICVWEHWQRLSDLAVREDFFAKVEKAGAVGVKIDFMESESHERLAFYRSCLQLGAKHRVMVNFHGANKPAGELRTWPNAITREGIAGIEQGGGLQCQHWAALPFTRLVTGPGDFTPTMFDPAKLNGTTMALQMAAAVIYTSPVEHWADSAEVYLKQPPEVIEFIRTKPTVWDETRVLPGSKIGEVAAFARRDGRNWWIGVVNGTEEKKDFDVTLPPLSSGKYRMVIIQDGDDGKKLEVLKDQLNPAERDANFSGRATVAHLLPRGGYVMMLKADD